MTLLPRTHRSIDAESDGRSAPFLLGAAGLLAAWLGWFCSSELSVYEVSETARFEVASATYEVNAPVVGRIAAMPGLALGRSVREGDVLVELDAESERLELEEARALETSLTAQIDAAYVELEAGRSALADHRKGTLSEVRAAKSRAREARVVAVLAAEELGRIEMLHARGTSTEVDAIRARAEVQRRRAEQAALSADISSLASESDAEDNDRRTRISAVDREIARLGGERRTVRAREVTLAHEIDRRTIRSGANGTIATIGDLRPGSVVRAGDRVATIVALGTLRVVGAFAPADVFGRVRPGQHARVECDGFPWTEYGFVNARVSTVAGEVSDRHARVELVIEGARPRRLPLQHGLPATVAIEVERTTPARLTLRAAGIAVGGGGSNAGPRSRGEVAAR